MTNIIIDESENIRENCLMYMSDEMDGENDVS